jgi:hypothetical protein
MKTMQRLRTRLRSWLGLEHSEALLLDELRQQSRRTTRNEEERDRLDKHLSDTRLDQHRAADSLQHLRREVEELGILARQSASALGGVWRTASGQVVPIRLLSDTHLKAIMDGSFGSEDTRKLVHQEIERRRDDDVWAARQGPGSMRTRLSKVEEQLLCLWDHIPYQFQTGTMTGRLDSNAGHDSRREVMIDPRVTFSYSPETAARVARYLPRWAQDLIGDLVKPNPRRVTREEQRRVRRLPFWAQQLVTDLRRPR